MIAIQTYDEIDAIGMTVGRLRARILSLPVEFQDEHQDFLTRELNNLTTSTVDEIWGKLCGYWNYLNYTLLENLIKNLGSKDPELIHKMESYLQLHKIFLQHTRVCDFAKHCPVTTQKVKTELKDFVIRLDLDWDKCTLEEVDNRADHIMRKFHLPKFLMNLKEITCGSILITWSLPAVLASRVRSELEITYMTSFKMKHGVLSITIDDQECKYSEVKHYSAYLKDLYSHNPNKTFKLVAIEMEIGYAFLMDKFTRATIRGNHDDVVYTKHHMEEDEIGCLDPPPRLILIEGAPGMGKTTFSRQLCYKWSQGQRLSKHKLLVLLPLRDKGVRSAKNVSDLFPHPQLQQAIAEKVEGSGGEGVALWLEGWDELKEGLRKKSSFFLDFLHGRVLPKATIIITSRPWATKNIRESASVKVDQHIEIITTPDTELQRVLEERIKPDSRAKFLDYMKHNLMMKAAMHTPVTANIVADVFQWCGDTESPLPTTMTELYTALICMLLTEHTHSKPIRSLDEVPEDVKNLCRLAWQGLVEQQKLTFSSDEVGEKTLGLTRAVKELYGGKDGQLSYHFIHLTLQEFLSAYHITQLPPDKQEQIIREHIDTGHLTMTVRFFFGLTKPNTLTSSLISHHISSQFDSESSNVFHWLFETGEGKPDGSGRRVHVRSTFSWSPLDYYVLGHAISQCNFSWWLYISDTSMGDEGIEMLCKGMSASTDNTCAGKITRADFSGNNITSEGVKWLHNIPPETLQQLECLELGFNEIDRSGLIAFSQVIPKLTMLQDLSLGWNPISEGGAVKVLRSLPLKTLDLRRTGRGEQDSVPLVQLIGDNVLETLKISGNLLPSIMKCPLPNSTLQTLSMVNVNTSLSEEATMSLSSLLQQSMLQFSKLDISY